jgi:hypothetical protein
MSLRTTFAGFVVAMLVAFVGTALAAEAAAQVVTVTGTVKAVAAEPGTKAPAAMVEVTEKGPGPAPVVVTYKVTNDEQGKKLAKEANGKKAEIKGTVETKGEESWLTVKEFKVLETTGAK